jgi:hypothetical protein
MKRMMRVQCIWLRDIDGCNPLSLMPLHSGPVREFSQRECGDLKSHPLHREMRFALRIIFSGGNLVGSRRTGRGMCDFSPFWRCS